MNRAICLFLCGGILLSLFVRDGTGCGMMTHMEISFRAAANFNRTYRGFDIRSLVNKHPDALHTGAVYPDSYYSNLCYKGEFHDTSETTHWMTFIGPALDYFNQQYASKPIDEAGEKLLVFFLGVMAHDVADVLWHSLGIDQGFIDSMAQVNFMGDFSASHTVADPGGDVVNLYEMFYPDTATVGAFEWYVPIQDVLNIYKNLGIAFNETIVQTCAVELMQVGADSERDTFDRLYPNMVSQSPFLGNRLTDFFLGGMNEMSSWVMQRWMTAFLYLESNGKNCTNTQGSINPMYWVCGNQPPIKPPPSSWLPAWQQDEASTHLHHKTKKIAFDRLSKRAQEARERGKLPTEVEIRKDSKLGAIFLKAKSASVKTVNKQATGSARLPRECNANSYYVENTYTSIGNALHSYDLNQNGVDDLIVGAPGYSFDNRFQEGRVFIRYGSYSGLPQVQLDLNQSADVTFAAPFTGSGRFGYSIAIVDFNGDRFPDLAVSAPTYSPDIVNNMYSGQVYIYINRLHKLPQHFNNTKPDVTIDCGMRFCNFGTTLSVGDVNRDGLDDLIIGSPYASQSLSNNKQNGFVAVYFSGQRVDIPRNLKLSDANVTLQGPAPYSWFGFSAVTTNSTCNLLVGAPATNHILPNGTVQQMSGSVYCYQYSKNNLSIFANGTKNFENFGSALAYGYPNGKSAQPVVLVAAANGDNDGKLYGILPLHLNQSGSVYFYSPAPGSNSFAKLAGDRHYANFGRLIKFANVNNDGYDDLIVGAPIRQPHLTDLGKGEAVGELYIYYGSDSFPQNTLQRPCKGDVDPCPGDQADQVFNLGANKAQFGSNAAFFRFGNETTQLLVSAPRTDDYARQSGKLVLYSGCDYRRRF